ncbi:C8orf37 protein [Chytridium lagenaria]|nr:C8orf37 protein [Chytridium lagenaria]
MAGMVADAANVGRVGNSPVLAASPSRRKCSPPCLGGAEDEIGITVGVASSPGAKTAPSSWRCCDRLRCLSCDFKCLSFRDAVWSPRSDYLFFRNHMPDSSKLSKNLQRKNGYNSYCCQCTWVSVNALAPIFAMPEADRLKWVCGGHDL